MKRVHETTSEALLDYARTLPGAVTDRPFKDSLDTVVLRHGRSRKWFGLILARQTKTILNVKIDPIEAVELREQFKSITPAYHMNKKHWISIELTGDVPFSTVQALLDASFELTAGKAMPTASGLRRSD